MILFVLSYVGGVLTILSPCILPVLPFVFARADQPFLKSGLPMLLGMRRGAGFRAGDVAHRAGAVSPPAPGKHL